jgi:aminopeptidase N
MGLRLETGKTQGAYDRVVYRKGGYVLYMLRQLMFDPKEGDKPFIAMMQDFVKQHMNQSASTEDFQRIADRHIRPEMDLERNGKLDWFFLEWVYGTAIPRYKFDYTVTPGSEGNWILKASLTQSEVTPDFAMLVPIYLDFDGQLTRLGTIRLHGNTTLDNIEVKLPKKPKRVLINAFHDVLTQ